MKGFITKSWDTYLDKLAVENRDIYFTERYAKLYDSRDASAEAFVYEDEGKVYIFPYVKRAINSVEGSYYDIETPYGYGGPISNCAEAGFAEMAFKEFTELAAENNIIAGFIRFHPLIGNKALVGTGCDVIFDRKTIAMDLRNSEEELWMNHVHKNHRNSIRKAEKAGLRFEADENFSHMKEFLEIYYKTLEALDTDEFYRFNDAYYENIRTTMAKDSFLGLVYLEDKIIAAIIYFQYGIYGHAHLGGSLAEYLNLCPNNFMLYKAALYLKSRGVQYFHFGGGTDGSEENSLYKYKKRFSKNEYDFYIGKMVLNNDVYNKACSEWESKFPEKKEKFSKFLLKYRY